MLNECYTEKADLWSVGVLMYQLLANRLPFDGNTDQDTMLAIRDGSFSFEGPAWRIISDEAKDLIKQLLRYNPNMRISAKEALKHPWI